MVSKKAQISVEIAVSVAIVIVLFLSVKMINDRKFSDVKEKQEYISIKNDCERIANTVNNIYRLGEGSSMVIPVMNDFDVQSNSKIMIKKRNEIVYCSPYVKLSENSYTKGKIRITNNGDIEIENI